MRDVHANSFELARQRCMNLGMNLAQYGSAEEYSTILDFFGMLQISKKDNCKTIDQTDQICIPLS